MEIFMHLRFSHCRGTVSYIICWHCLFYHFVVSLVQYHVSLLCFINLLFTLLLANLPVFSGHNSANDYCLSPAK